MEEAFRQARVELNRRIQVNYSMTAIMLAAQGAGIALVEPMLLSDATPGLVAKAITPGITVRTLLAHPIGRPPTKTSSKLVELVRTYFERMDETLVSQSV